MPLTMAMMTGSTIGADQFTVTKYTKQQQNATQANCNDKHCAQQCPPHPNVPMRLSLWPLRQQMDAVSEALVPTNGKWPMCQAGSLAQASN